MFFDWISPLLQIGEMVRGGEQIHVVPARGMTGADVKRLLEFNGVQVGASAIFIDGGWMLTVDNRAKAQRILGLYGMGP